MKESRPANIFLALISLVLISSCVVRPQSRAIDVSHSTLKVRVFKTGLFSPFAHDHEIEAPISEGSADLSPNTRVTLRVDARRLHVVDPGTSESDRAQIQKTMEGPPVLDSERFPQISFESTRIEQLSDDRWKLHGRLSLHGQTNSIDVEVTGRDGHYLGATTISQRDFGITPVSIARGTIKVKDQVRVEFAITLAEAASSSGL